MPRGADKIDAYHAHEAAKEKRKAKRDREKRVVGARPFKLSKEELNEMLAQAEAWVDDPEKLARYIKVKAAVILQVDATLGTESWRMRGTAGMAISAQSRARFLEQAGRLLDDIRASMKRGDTPQLLEGVIANR